MRVDINHREHETGVGARNSESGGRLSGDTSSLAKIITVLHPSYHSCACIRVTSKLGFSAQPQ
eukprot:230612-Rhodomonas_salina.2